MKISFAKKLYPAILLTALFFCSCVTEKPVKERMVLGVPEGKFRYKDVNPAPLELVMISKPVLRAGEKAELIFSLKNNGSRAVDIQEWLRHEPDNIVISIQPWLTEMTQPDPERWIELSFDRRKPVFHYPLTLMPGNQAMIAKELPFIEKLRIAPRSERRFFVKAAMTLKSLKLSSKVFTIRVLPQQVFKAE